MDDTTLYAKDPSGRAALIHMSTACLYDHSDAVSLTFRGTSEICGPLDVEIAGSATSHIPSSCLISSITPLTKDEAKVYEAKKVY